MLRVAIAVLFGGALVVLLATDGRASLHHPEDTISSLPVEESGPVALPFDEFSRRRLILRNIGNSTWPLVAINPQTKEPIIDPKTKAPRLTERGEVEARIKREQKKRAEDRTPEESAFLATDLLRFGRPEEAESQIKAQHRRTFLPNMTLAHITAAQGQWARAYEFLDIANELADSKRAPVSVPGTSPAKLKWQLALNKGALRTFIKLRADEAKGAKQPQENELPDRIFGVTFANETGVLTAAEKAKLPPDALATVQQLVLWFPYDWRLYWLLGELYAAKGEFRAAQKIMDECVYSGSYSNRKALMQHREAVAKFAVVAERFETLYHLLMLGQQVALNVTLVAPPETEPVGSAPDAVSAPQTEQPPPPPVPFTLNAVWWYFGAVGALALFALVRALMRKGKSAPN